MVNNNWLTFWSVQCLDSHGLNGLKVTTCTKSRDLLMLLLKELRILVFTVVFRSFGLSSFFNFIVVVL